MDLLQLIKFKRGRDFDLPERLLCLDPGHTTGWAIFARHELANSGTSNTVLNNEELNWPAIEDLFNASNPTHVVCEDYKMYANKAQQHIGQSVFTLRLIGVIDYLCYLRGIPIYYQMASHAKSFWTNEKLESLKLVSNNKHARDAVRHGCQLITFNKEFKGVV